MVFIKMKRNFYIIVVLFAAGIFIFSLAGSKKEWAVTSSVHFDKSIETGPNKKFGPKNQFTFEMFRNEKFLVEKEQGYLLQSSPFYRDSGWIRSTRPLPPTYRVSVVVGEIDYELESVKGLLSDSKYSGGPSEENGVYLLTITDVIPDKNHTNDWWHQHRKLVVDIDNNVWGSGMPHPIFMVYFDPNNELVSFDGTKNKWTGSWVKAWEYNPKAWYLVEIEKTPTFYILRLSTEEGRLLREARVPHNYVWHSERPEYFVIGDPHENYYKGSMKIKSVEISVN